MSTVVRSRGGLLGWLRDLVAGAEIADLEARLARAEARIVDLERRLAEALAEPTDPAALALVLEERDARIEVLESELGALRAALDRTRGAA